MELSLRTLMLMLLLLPMHAIAQDLAGRGAKLTLQGEIADGDRQQW